jgi:hypothetical protein
LPQYRRAAGGAGRGRDHGALGFVFERVIIRQVYGAPLRADPDHHRR